MARGKVILFGEHAVVYGQPAVAAALQAGIVTTDVRTSSRLQVTLVGTGVCAARGDGSRLGDALDRLASTLETSLGPLPPLALTLQSDLPVGAGLGSSAALAVAIGESLLAGVGLAERERLDLLLDAARASELVFHGNPSGIDHTTSACGGVLRYQRGLTPPFAPLPRIAPIPLIVAQMEPGADTGLMVAGVRALRESAPSLVDPLIAWLGQIAVEAIHALEAHALEAVGRLMNLAHGGLVALGVSTEALDRGCHAARGAGAWGAKLTGAGGGGCLIAVGPPERTDAIAAALRAAGASMVLPTLAGART